MRDGSYEDSTLHPPGRHGAFRTRRRRVPPLETDEDRIDALYEATADATEAAIDDALFSAHTLTGLNGTTVYNLPYERVKALLPAGSLRRHA
jgi:L-aminopeptidase/D-esterase-like protein